jgi:hypothetical protein
MYGEKPNVEAIDDTGYIDRNLVMNPDQLFNIALKWCKGHK